MLKRIRGYFAVSMENTTLFSASYPLAILIADPHPETHLTTKNLLCQLGYQPEVAASRQEVQNKTSTKAYDVIMVDMELLEVEGIPAVTGVYRKNKRPLIISMTSDAKLNFKQVCLKIKTDHFIMRPVDLNELSLQLKAYSLLMGKCRIGDQK
jgi:DNA-binding response OmpR family regulator